MSAEHPPPGTCQRGFWLVPSCTSGGPRVVARHPGLSPVPLPALPPHHTGAVLGVTAPLSSDSMQAVLASRL